MPGTATGWGRARRASMAATSVRRWGEGMGGGGEMGVSTSVSRPSRSCAVQDEELETALVVELVGGTHDADVSLLDQIAELKSASDGAPTASGRGESRRPGAHARYSAS